MKSTREKRLSYTEQANRILEQMSLEEKVYLMSGNQDFQQFCDDCTLPGRHYNHLPYPAGGNDRLALPPVTFCDGPRGVVCGTGKSTCFPVTMLRGATFDTDLERKIGRAIGQEVRAFHSNLFAGVCINLPYNPGWGRSQETYGEDSFHLGEMGSALAEGVQEQGVIACVKHFAFNQMEISRFQVDIDCDERTAREVFLPHFKKCIDRGTACVMSSYNLFRGDHCGQSDYLLNQVLKKEWGFDGFVISDFGWGIQDTVKAANSGMDIEMPSTIHFGPKLVEAVRSGKVAVQIIDRAVLRIIRTLLAFEDMPVEPVRESVLGCKEHVRLALEAAREGITLLKNENNVLPLNRRKVKRLVVLGELAEENVIGDHGSSQVFPPYVVTPLQGIANTAPSVDVVYYSGENIGHAKELAQQADAVIFVVGYTCTDEGEFISEDMGSIGGDRCESLGLHPKDIRLIREVGPLNRQSAVVLIGGNMIMMESWKDSVSAILMAYYPGMEGGTAIGEILFGDVNPSGKLPFVVPVREIDLPQVNWRTRRQRYDYYHGYTRLEKNGIEPSLPYGFGLSYTTFAYRNPEFRVEGGEILASCELTNTGSRDGSEVTQLYVGFSHSAVDRPVKLLRGFRRTALKAGETRRVEIRCPVEELQWYNPATGQMELEHMEYELYIGASSADRNLLKGCCVL